MKTFKEWVQENHPEYDLLDEKTGWLGKAAVAAGLAAGSVLGSAKGAAPQPPAGITQSEEHGEYSEVPFSKDLAVHLAPEMGLNPDKIAVMDDFDAWHEVMRKVNRIEREISKHNFALSRGAVGIGPKPWPRWYIKFGTYYNPKGGRDMSKWKAPEPPKVSVRGVSGMTGGGR